MYCPFTVIAAAFPSSRLTRATAPKDLEAQSVQKKEPEQASNNAPKKPSRPEKRKRLEPRPSFKVSVPHQWHMLSAVYSLLSRLSARVR